MSAPYWLLAVLWLALAAGLGHTTSTRLAAGSRLFYAALSLSGALACVGAVDLAVCLGQWLT